jgi:hypothetical protein
VAEHLIASYLRAPQCRIFSLSNRAASPSPGDDDQESVEKADERREKNRQLAIIVAEAIAKLAAMAAGHQDTGEGTLAHLRYLEQTGRSFPDAGSLITAVQSCYSNSFGTKKAIYAYLMSDKCRLFGQPQQLSMAAVGQFCQATAAGPDTLPNLKGLSIVNPGDRFEGLNDQRMLHELKMARLSSILSQGETLNFLVHPNCKLFKRPRNYKPKVDIVVAFLLLCLLPLDVAKPHVSAILIT